MRALRGMCMPALRGAALLLLALVTAAAEGALPRPLAQAFREARIPLDAVAVVVQDVRAPRPLVAHRANAAMSAASVMKLVTTYAALDMLGPDYRWRTEAYVDGRLADGVLDGNLVLKGYGDPKITIEQWQAFMARLRARGIDRITGDLILDRSHFDVPPHDRAAFDNAPLRPYNVGPDPLLVNFNAVKLAFAPDATRTRTLVAVEPALSPIRVANAPALVGDACEDWRGTLGAMIVDRHSAADIAFTGVYPADCGERTWYVALLDPAAYVHAMFSTYFRAAGGTFDGSWREGAAPRGSTPLAVLESPPLYDIVRDVNKLSNNVMARQLFLTLGARDGNGPASVARSSAAVRTWLSARRIAMPQLALDNGSGLSRAERVSAGGLVRLLLHAERSRVREEFSTSLAVAATDGTVEQRFRNRGVAGQALLKTGTLDGVRAIAGYVLDPDGGRWAVAAFVNHPEAARAQPALDHLVQWIYRDAAAWAHVIPPR